jgi:hypothetical protein
MDTTFLRALVVVVPVCMLISGAALTFFRERSTWSFLQLVGAGGLVVVVFAHVCEALQLFRWMGWGLEDSPGHYIDLSGALLGATLFPVGYFLDALGKRCP